MCYSPVHLLNPKLKTDNVDSQFDQASDKLYVDVPCGKCGECKQKKMDDYYVRTYYQYQETKSKGGFCFMNTYTMNEESIPYFHGLTCFDSEMYVKFRHNLNNHLRSKFGDLVNGNVRNFFVSEFGAETARAHHHCLHFVTIPGCSPAFFSECCERAWIYGFTQTNQPYFSHGKPNKYYKHPELCVVEANDAIAYVGKYVNKEQDFLEIVNKQPLHGEFVEWYQNKSYQDYVCHYLSNCSLKDFEGDFFPDDMIKKAVEEGTLMSRVEFDMFYPFKNITYQDLFKILDRKDYNRFMPYNRISQQYGISILEEDIERLNSGYVLLPDKEQGLKRYKLPMYVDRKKFYDYNKKTKCFTLNELGKKMKLIRTELNSDYVSKQMATFFNYWHSNIRQDLFNEIMAHIRLQVCSNIEALEDLDLFIESNLDGRSWVEYTNYLLVYKDMILPKEDVLYFDSAVTRNYDLVHNLCIHDYLDKSQIPYGDKRLFNYFISDLTSKLANDHYEFRGFENISKVYNIIREKLSQEKQFEYLHNKKLQSQEKYYKTLFNGKY